LWWSFCDDLQDAEYLFVAGFQFRQEFLLQLKCDILVGGQDRAYSFRNVQNREMLRNVYKGPALENFL
jgi:hypothetical protein